ncbi:hypothetical protein [uncultured Thermosynechococcus sp.]|uniref:hypothetical protein n=1 Tax=uncultured Thermosynechococcus sp. TaxID=436945 RepID=UPI0026092756|nr:hypothetical protein [uncultured Thermosynechococcus sp.]
MSNNDSKVSLAIACVSFVFLFSLPSTALVQKYFGLIGILSYLTIITVTLVSLLKLRSQIFSFVSKFYFAILICVIGFGIACFWILYPIENKGLLGIGSDRDEALNIAFGELMQGRYPYFANTHLGGKITPLPGAILIASPFILLGNSAYQNLFWLGVFIVLTTIYLESYVSAIIMLIFLSVLSPAFQYEYISGGDLIANSIYVLTAIFLQMKALPSASLSAKISTSLFTGIALASRSNFLTLLPLIFILFWRASGRRLAVTLTYLSVSVLTFISIVMPFYLVLPNSFPPFFAGNKLNELNASLPFVSTGIILLTLLVSLFLSLHLVKVPTANLLRSFMICCAAVQTLPMVCGVLLMSILNQQLDFRFLSHRYGLLFLFFALWGLWPVLLAQNPSKGSAPSA